MLHTSIVFVITPGIAQNYYIDTYAMRHKKPYKYYNKQSQYIDLLGEEKEIYAGGVNDLMKINDRRMKALKNRRPKARPMVRRKPQSINAAAINEINSFATNRNEPSYKVARAMFNREFEKALAYYNN